MTSSMRSIVEAHRGAEDYTKLVSDEVLNVASQQWMIKLAVTLGTALGLLCTDSN